MAASSLEQETFLLHKKSLVLESLNSDGKIDHLDHQDSALCLLQATK